MSALTTHLREPGEHGALAFHPACPVCREQRLLGTLHDRPLLSSRTQAALAAGVLAASALASVPAAIAASEPPSEHEGQAAPEDPGSPGESFHSPDFDPGGPDTELPVQVGPEDLEADPDAGVPLEAEPDTDPGVVPETTSELGAAPDTPPAPGVQELAAPQAPTPAPAPAPPPAPTADPLEPAPPAPAQPKPGEEPSPPHTQRPPRRQGGERSSARSRAEQARPPEPSAPAESAPLVTVPPEVVTVETESSSAPVPAVAASSRAEPGDRVHVVQRGESLWSIARDLVGPRASIAEVARQVNRLWELNRKRIGTGDADLILPGTRLRLS